MNIFPNSSALVASNTIPSNNNQQIMITNNNENVEIDQTLSICSVCKSSLIGQSSSKNNNELTAYRMLAVRPSIGCKGPFFPILETLTQTSAITVPCCMKCSDLLLEQWNEYELKNIPINNRSYNLNQIKISNSNNIMIMTDSNLPHPQMHTNKSLSSIISISAAAGNCNNGNLSATRIIAHPISLSTNTINENNHNNNNKPINLQQTLATKEAPCPQDEVLDLSVTGANSNSNSNFDVKIPETSNLTSVTIPAAVLTTNKSTIITGHHRPRASSSSSSSAVSGVISGDNIISINPYSLMNSSMNNLIKVSASPSVLASNPSSTDDKNLLSSSIMMAKKPSYSCTICDEQCSQLFSILLRPMGNCPYFPTLSQENKIHAFESNGKIGVCESCHHNLIVQWDSFQKANKPIMERKYHLFCNKQENDIVLNTRNSRTTINNNNQINYSISASTAPPISQSLVSLVATNKIFFCLMCGKDLIQASNNNPPPPTITSQLQLSHGSSIDSNNNNDNKNNNNNNTSPPMPIAFSVLTENDSSGNVIQKKLILQSAQEINLLPFITSSLSSSATANSPSTNAIKQLQLLNENGRVLICHSCFSSINSLPPSSVIQQSDCNNINVSSLEQQQTIVNDKVTTIRSSNHPSNNSSNGIAPKTQMMHPKSMASTTATNSDPNEQNTYQLCPACKQHKSEYWVETKENAEKKPFYPFLHDANELVNGRARICAQCHLILEIQWDCFENDYVPYNQRVYRLSSSAKRPLPPPSSTQLPSASAVVATTTTTLAQSSSSPAIITQVVNGQPACPLKIHIAVPNSSSTMLPLLSQTSSSLGVAPVNHIQNNPSEHLLLTTVRTPHPITSNYDSQDQHFNKLLNDLLNIIGGPITHLPGICPICSQHNDTGQAYQIFVCPQNRIISPELGIYPYFPMFKSSNHKKSPKIQIDNNQQLVCTYCFHSLMAQWIAYHLSTKPEDRNFTSRHYDCQNYVCYVCGVTTYRQFVRSILVKDFPFLRDHKQPPGSLKLNKGDSVVTCLTCHQTLTHQWTENERMKVPLEMRKYNWMAVPPPPKTPTLTNNESIIESNSKQKSHSERTIIPILAPTTSLSYQLNDDKTINHNGILSVSAASNEILPKTAIIINANDSNTNHIVSNNNNIVEQQIHADQLSSSSKLHSTLTNNFSINTTPASFNPSHTLAPLVAAAMAATPVTIIQEMSVDKSSNETIKTINNNINGNTPANNVNVATTSATTVLRHLARQHCVQIQYPPQIIQQQQLDASNSINLTTLASAAAMAGNNRHLSSSSTSSNSSQFNASASSSINENNHHSNHLKQPYDGQYHSTIQLSHTNPHQTELPKAVINSNSFALHFNALNNNNTNHDNNQQKHHKQQQKLHTKTKKSKIEQYNKMEETRSEQIMKNNCIISNNNRFHQEYLSHLQQRIDRLKEQINELKESIQSDSLNEPSMDDDHLSEVNLEVIKLWKKRSSQLNRLNEKLRKLELHKQSPPSMMKAEEKLIFDNEDEDDDNLTDMDDNENGSNDDIIIINDDDDDHKSKIEFMDQVLPPLPLKENDDEDLGKLEFLSLLGLTTHRMKREDDLDNFLQTKMNRRLSHASFKVDRIVDDDNDILEIDPNYETFKKWPHFTQSNINPNSDLLFSKNVFKHNRNKSQFMETLGLKQIPVEKKLKNEFDWVAVIRNRQMRRELGLISIGKQYQNLDEQTLRNWIISMISSSISDVDDNSDDSAIIKRIKTEIMPNLDDYFCYKMLDKSRLLDQNQMMTIDCNPPVTLQSMVTPITTPPSSQTHQIKKNAMKYTNTIIIADDNHQPIAKQPVQKMPITAATITTAATNKILNSRRFAQEFHESVLLETQKQMNGKHQAHHNNDGSVVNILNPSNDSLHYQQQQQQQPQSLLLTSSLNAHQPHAAIIYNDHFRPLINANASDTQQPQILIDRNGLIKTITSPSGAIITPIKVSTFTNTFSNPANAPATIPPDKKNISDQIQKLQQRIDDINREHSGLNEKRNEISMVMQKLEKERLLFQMEIERLRKCLDV